MSDFIYTISEDSDYLMHHGIKGQKWGIENGPPYPLNPSKDYSAAEKKLNKAYVRLEENKSAGKSYRNTRYGLKEKVYMDKKTAQALNKASKFLSKKMPNKAEDVPDYVKDMTDRLNSMIKEYGDIKINDPVLMKRRGDMIRNKAIGSGVWSTVGTAAAIGGGALGAAIGSGGLAVALPAAAIGATSIGLAANNAIQNAKLQKYLDRTAIHE